MNCSVCHAEMVKAGVGWLCPECGHLQVHELVPIEATIRTDRKAGLRPPKPVEQPVPINFGPPVAPIAGPIPPTTTPPPPPSPLPVTEVAAAPNQAPVAIEGMPPHPLTSFVESVPTNPPTPVSSPVDPAPATEETPHVAAVAPTEQPPVSVNIPSINADAPTEQAPVVIDPPLVPVIAPPSSETFNQPDPANIKPFELISRPASIGIGSLGIVIVILGLFFLAPNQHPLGYKTTPGVVINTAHDQTKVQFTVNKKMYSFNDNSKTQVYSPGDHVSVAYNPSKPSAAPVNISDKTTPLGAIIAIGTGVIALLMGVAGFISTFFVAKTIEPKPAIAKPAAAA